MGRMAHGVRHSSFVQDNGRTAGRGIALSETIIPGVRECNCEKDKEAEG